MKKQNALILSVCMVMASLFVGCGLGKPSPEKVLTKYLDAKLNGKYEEAYESLSSSDQAAKSLTDYVAHQSSVESPFLDTLAEKVSYEIIETAVDGNKARIEVSLTLPDASALMADLFGAALLSAFGGDDDGEMINGLLAEKLKQEDLPMVTNTEFYDLVKETGRWRVFLDLERREKIAKTINQAEELEEGNKLFAAKEKYQEVLELDSKTVKAVKKIEELDDSIRQFEEKQAYVEYIELRNIRVGKSVLNDQGVFGEVKNLGHRTLTEVEITIYCLDEDGNPIHELTYHPVLVSEWSFRDNQPLKPNYTRKFGCKLDDAPSDWAGEVLVKVSDIEFED